MELGFTHHIGMILLGNDITVIKFLFRFYLNPNVFNHRSHGSNFYSQNLLLQFLIRCLILKVYMIQ